MWPLELYGGTGVSSISLGGYDEVIELYQTLGVLEQAGIQFGLTVLLGAVVLGMLPEYGRRTLDKSRCSPVISVVFGIPGAIILGGLFYVGLLIIDTSIGVFFGIALVSLGMTLLPAWTAIGFVAIGAGLSRRFGIEQLWAWVLVGGLLGALSLTFSPAGFVLLALAASIGVGAGVRVLLGGGGIRPTEERTVPPANKV